MDGWSIHQDIEGAMQISISISRHLEIEIHLYSICHGSCRYRPLLFSRRPVGLVSDVPASRGHVTNN